MSSSTFVCIFCSDKFESKASLAEHFRTHAKDSGGKTYSKYGKVENRVFSKGKVTIKCDVCTEEFFSTTDAISHKYKKHRDAPIKHFCPWCGKQFPIKHIWELHLETHAHEVKPSTTIKCDICDSEFYNKKARTYHEKSFHRTVYLLDSVDTPPPSKKISVNSHGDVLSTYYCNFCGSEYVIKYNLQKHIHDHHLKELGSPPVDLIKCKICDALFNSEKAYNFHTTYHKTNDLYVTSEEMRQHVVTKVDQSFDFRRVKSYSRVPSKKKMRTMMDDVGKNYFQIGDLSNYLPPSSDNESDENSNEASKNKRKHGSVSSGSEAITLDEFVNMNKDIFSDCFDTKADSSNAEIKNESIQNGNDSDVKIKSEVEEPVTPVPIDTLISTVSDDIQNKDSCPSKAVEISSIDDKILPRILKKATTKEILVKKIAVPPGAAIQGLKIITGDELKKMKQQGIVLSVVSKPPTTLNNIIKKSNVLSKILPKTHVQPSKTELVNPVGDILETDESDIKVAAECDSSLNESINEVKPTNKHVEDGHDKIKNVSTCEPLNGQNNIKPIVKDAVDVKDALIRVKCLTSKAVVLLERDKALSQPRLRSAVSSMNSNKSVKSTKVYTRRVNCARSVKNVK